MKLLRAVDAALTAFAEVLWPEPKPLEGHCPECGGPQVVWHTLDCTVPLCEVQDVKGPVS